MERQTFMERFFFKKNHKLDLKDFDAFAKEDLLNAKKRALNFIGIDNSLINEFNPVIITTPITQTKKVEPIYVYGEDKMRFDLAKFSSLFFSNNVLFHYTCVIDHKTGAMFNDKVVEIPYFKIKTIETSSKFTKIDNERHHVFEITLVLDNLNNINIPLRVLLVDNTTDKADYLLSKETLNLAADLKAFLRTKLLR